MLNQYTEKPLHRSQQRPMNHVRAMGLPILCDVGDIEPLWQIKIELDRRTLPRAPDSVFNLHIDFGTIKGSPALFYAIGQFLCFSSPFQRIFCPLPISSSHISRTCRTNISNSLKPKLLRIKRVKSMTLNLSIFSGRQKIWASS